MFYSHTFLARKSPLGTVWIAAHLERRIKKPQIEVVDIPSYADCIMFPEVPIALRLSGHLLLGLVRIYSWKVNYLFQDCNRVLTDVRTVFASIQVNLPVDADRAPFEHVTLPDTFELDTLQLDDSIYQIEGPDNHLKTYDQITMQDQIPMEEGEPYVAFFIDEDNRPHTSSLLEISNPRVVPMEEEYVGPVVPMEEDVLPPFEGGLEALALLENAVGFSHSGPSKQAEGPVQSLDKVEFTQDFPEIEVMRDAVLNIEPENLADGGDAINDISGPYEQSNPSINTNVCLSSIMEGLYVPGGVSLPSPSCDKVPIVASANDLDILSTGISRGGPIPDLEVQSSPPVEQQKPKKRKRKQYFDESLVLTNAELKKQLQDSSKLVFKRKKLPCSALDVWNFRKTLQKECVLHEPLLSGMCIKLLEGFERRFPPPRSESSSMEASWTFVNAVEMDPLMPDREEPEQPRFGGHADGSLDNLMPSPSGREEFTPRTNNLGLLSDKRRTLETEVSPTLEIPTSGEGKPHLDDTNLEPFSVLPSAPVEASPGLMDAPEMEPEQPRFGGQADGGLFDVMPSSSGIEDLTPLHTNNLGSLSDNDKTLETEAPANLQIPSSGEPIVPELETPPFILERRLHLDDTNLGEPPSMLQSGEPPSVQQPADIEELTFLEASNALSGPDVIEAENMSARTRAVAQYLKEHSPASVILEDQSASLSLNRILERKPRKQCARMFFETMVLKTYDLIDVLQEEAYGDILISPMPALSSMKF